MAKATKLKNAEETEAMLPTAETIEASTPIDAEVVETIEIVDVNEEVEIKKESDEILFLRTILEIQDNGGWGKNLHPIINDRINYLKSL